MMVWSLRARVALLMMLLALSLVFVAGVARAQKVVVREANEFAPVVVQLDGIPTGTLVTMLLRDIMRVPYVIAPDVLADKRPTAVRLVIPRNDVPGRVVGYLRKSGFTVELLGGAVYVGKGRSSVGSPALQSVYGSSMPSGSPLDPGPQNPLPDPVDRKLPYPAFARGGEVEPSEPSEILAYIPAHREPAYLSSVVTSVLPKLGVAARVDVQADTSQSRIAPESGPDTLVLTGSQDDLRRARKLIEVLDRPRPMVAVKAVVVQMSNVNSRGSALTILARLGDGRLTSGLNPAESSGANFVRLAAGATSAVISAVREDSRFKVVATPNLSALSGATATMNAGASVPTVGTVSIAEGGTPVQSIVYRDSGITLSVRPIVRGDLVELAVKQERSTFTRTATGVENSPTLQKSTAEASVTLKSGESIVLAGLTEASDGKTREGLFGGLLGVRSAEKSDSELMVILTAEIVPQPTAPPGQFIEVESEAKEDELAPA